MKKNLRRFAFILIFTISSVGFRYAPMPFGSLVNIYLADSLLLVADEKYGIYVYSVAATDTPSLKTTIPKSGVRGMAIKDSIIYAGAWDGIYAFRLKGETGYDTVCTIPTYTYMGDDMVVQREESFYPFFNCGCHRDYAAGGTETSNGVGGSYAVFAIIDTFLYYVSESSLITMSVARPESPRELSRLYLGWTVETLYPMAEYLYIGGQTGMYVIDRVNGAKPSLIGSLQHFQACDPVVVQDTIAYVTLRSGNGCGAVADELLTLSVADPVKPRLLHEDTVVTPYGLAVNDSLLYMANGYAGYSLYRVGGGAGAEVVKQWEKPAVKDFILSGDKLYIMGFNSMQIVNVADPMEPKTVVTLQ
jgi:hypothetical protein